LDAAWRPASAPSLGQIVVEAEMLGRRVKPQSVAALRALDCEAGGLQAGVSACDARLVGHQLPASSADALGVSVLDEPSSTREEGLRLIEVG